MIGTVQVLKPGYGFITEENTNRLWFFAFRDAHAVHEGQRVKFEKKNNKEQFEKKLKRRSAERLANEPQKSNVTQNRTRYRSPQSAGSAQGRNHRGGRISSVGKQPEEKHNESLRNEEAKKVEVSFEERLSQVERLIKSEEFEKNMSDRFLQAEIRHRRMWQQDIQAALRGQLSDLLSHVESGVAEFANERPQCPVTRRYRTSEICPNPNVR
jgi:cold shock CspA family protein